MSQTLHEVMNALSVLMVIVTSFLRDAGEWMIFYMVHVSSFTTNVHNFKLYNQPYKAGIYSSIKSCQHKSPKL